MACSNEGLEISDGTLCGICSKKQYDVPKRKLACGHTFCENCLFTFVFDLKENGKLESSFQCPVCGTAHSLQETGDITLEWVQTFPLVTDITESDMGSCDAVSELPEDSEEAQKCGPCAENGEDTIAGKHFCLECEAHLCDVCLGAHKKYKTLKSHKILDSIEMSDREDTIPDIHKYRKCKKHPDRDVELFCNDDEVFICLVCATTAHKNCKSVVEASECSGEIEQVANNLKERMDKTQKHLHTLRQLLGDKGTAIQAQAESFVSEIMNIKHEIFSSVEVIVENACTIVRQLRQDVSEKDTATAEDIGRLEESFNKKQRYIDTLSKYGNSPELSMGSVQVKVELGALEYEVLKLDEGVKTAEFDRAVVEKLKQVSQQLQSNEMPDVTMINKASNHEPKYISLLEKPSPFVVQSTEVHEVKLVDACFPTFTGVSVGKDGQLILCDSCDYDQACGFVSIYNPTEKKKNTLKLKRPLCAEELNTKTVALTMASDKKITVITLGRDMREERSLTTKYQPRSIVSLKDGNVAISWTDPPGFSIAVVISGSTMQESKYLTQDNEGRKFKSFEFMAIDETRGLVIQPCEQDKAVYGFNFSGKPVFKYTNNLKCPNGVAVDSKSGSVFVCDNLDHSIHQLSMRGQPVAVLQHLELKWPLNVCYDKKRKCLWITKDSPPYQNVLCLKQA